MKKIFIGSVDMKACKIYLAVILKKYRANPDRVKLEESRTVKKSFNELKKLNVILTRLDNTEKLTQKHIETLQSNYNSVASSIFTEDEWKKLDGRIRQTRSRSAAVKNRQVQISIKLETKEKINQIKRDKSCRSQDEVINMLLDKYKMFKNITLKKKNPNKVKS